MRRLLLVLPLLVLAGCKEEAPHGAVKVTVSYSGFKPGCVRVLARDTATGKELSTTVQGKGEPTGGSLVVAVMPEEGWGTTVDVEARAFEKACEGDPVVYRTESATLTRGEVTAVTLQLLATDEDQDGYVDVLSGGTDCRDREPAIHPDAEERCNDVDDNCNGQVDTDVANFGQVCTAGANCSGTYRCGGNGALYCDVPGAQTAWPDMDRDGHGDSDAAPESFCNGVPAGYVTSLTDDCDDDRADVYSGAPERCDGRDNDCDGSTDEGHPINTACTVADTQCGGQFQCDAVSGVAVCVPAQTASTWYPDEDGDGYGNATQGEQSCVQPAGTITQGGDCDDGNRFTRTGATEICDGADNNCDGLADGPGVCIGTPGWVNRTVGSGGQNWRSVFASPSGGVGIVGHGGVRARLTAGSASFQAATTSCGDNGPDWNAVWMDASNSERLYFASVGGLLAYQDSMTANCTLGPDLNRIVRGLVGVRNGSALELHGVTYDSGTTNFGLTFIWNGGTGSGSAPYGTTEVSNLFDVHGVSRNALFAVGGYDAGGGDPASPRIYRFDPMAGQWRTERVQDTVTGVARLNAVWVVDETLAFAVGEQNSVMKWNGSQWSKLPFTSERTESLRGVVAFGANSVYAAAYNGRIYRYDGQQWHVFYDDTSARFTDIAGTSPADLWVVGETGLVRHWPQ